MADYISRDYTVENMENYPWDTEHDKNAAIHLVRELVPADVVEVVRCKDCKRWKDPHDYECPCHASGDPYIDYDPEPDFFCAIGERRAEWISVKERLPDDYVPVLVYAKHIDDKRTVFLVDHIIGYTNGCKTWADIDKTWKYFVTHWMPLPEPPKEGGQADGN